MGPAAEPAVPLLIEALEADEPMRSAAASANSTTTTRELPYGVRRTAAYALGNIGPAARVAVPALTKASQAESKELRMAAASALKKIQGRPGNGPAKPK
jgi:HEAT repeat protein